MTPSAKRYLDEALATFERASLHKNTVHWKALRDSAYAWADGASTPEQTWPAIHRALITVDARSFLMTPRPMPPTSQRDAEGAMAGAVAADPYYPEPDTELLERAYGLIVVRSFSGPTRQGFIDTLQQTIRSFDEGGACGWIVDLRFNRGGNMWPMLTGIGSLLDAGRVGAFRFVGSRREYWYYRDGQAWAGSPEPPVDGKARQPVHRLRKADAPVALLLGGATSGSGEAVAVAFLGRRNLRSFGDSTAGSGISNGTYPLPDGARMAITNATFQDRLGRLSPLRIGPDEVVPRNDQEVSDGPLDRAKAWLSQQPACVSRGDARK